MWKILRQIVVTGVRTQTAPESDDTLRVEAGRIQSDVLEILGRALAIRAVDAGSCNGCELEIHALSWTIVFGLGFATFITLIILPVMYLKGWQLKQWWDKKF